MSSNKGMFGMLIAVILVLAFMGTVALYVVNQADRARAELPVLGQVGEFQFVDNYEEPFGLTDLKGRVSVVAFMFTRCKAICPIMAVGMIDLYNSFENSERVQLVSISVDPEHDLPAVTTEYLQNLGVTDARWRYLTGPIDDVVQLCEGDFMLAAEDLPGGHATKLVLVDQAGAIRGYYDGMDEASVKILKTHITELVKQSQ